MINFDKTIAELFAKSSYSADYKFHSFKSWRDYDNEPLYIIAHICVSDNDNKVFDKIFVHNFNKSYLFDFFDNCSYMSHHKFPIFYDDNKSTLLYKNKSDTFTFPFVFKTHGITLYPHNVLVIANKTEAYAFDLITKEYVYIYGHVSKVTGGGTYEKDDIYGSTSEQRKIGYYEDRKCEIYKEIKF